MKLRIMQSDKGDCLLLEARSGELVLCDGGMGKAMGESVRHELADLRKKGRAIEYAYVSHIDNDHINGVLELLSDALDWKLYDRAVKRGQDAVEPQSPRPPEIKGVLHNGFPAQLEAAKVPERAVTEAVAVTRALSGPPARKLGTPAIDAGEAMLRPFGVIESLELERYLRPDALRIPLNRLPGAARGRRLLYEGSPRDGSFTIGSMRFTLLGPTIKELDQLKEGWTNFLKRERADVDELLKGIDDRLRPFDADGEAEPGFGSRNWEGIKPFKNVTIPNISSLMFMMEEGTKKLLLTGDGQQDFIIAGLERTGFLTTDSETPLLVDVLKVQHHGSENNLDLPFANRVHADHYVFCGDGSHGNPDDQVITDIEKSRERDDRPYAYWFSTVPNPKDNKPGAAPGRYKHLAAVQQRIDKIVAKSNGRVTVHLNTGVGIDLKI